MIRLRPRERTPPPAEIPVGKRVYAIGDIHGRLDLLDELLALIHADNAGRATADTTIILLGDLIDRGPQSAGVVRRAMEPLGWASTIAIKGNHEAAMLDALSGDRAMMKLWRSNGGNAALASWGVTRQTLAEASTDQLIEVANRLVPAIGRAWLERMRQWIRVGGYYFAHAGIRPGVALDRQTAADNLWIREDFLESKRDHGAMIVHGHSMDIEVQDRGNRIGIDTGAYASGRLTALGLEGPDRWFLQTAAAA